MEAGSRIVLPVWLYLVSGEVRHIDIHPRCLKLRLKIVPKTLNAILNLLLNLLLHLLNLLLHLLLLLLHLLQLQQNSVGRSKLWRVFQIYKLSGSLLE